MLMKLLINVFERARSKLSVTRSNGRMPSDSDIEITNFDCPSQQHTSAFQLFPVQQQQPRSSLSKWLCSTPTPANRSISSLKANKVRRTGSWRSLKERANHSITSRTLSVDELRRNNKQCQPRRRRDLSHSPIIRRKSSESATNSQRFDRLSSTLINYSTQQKKSPRRKPPLDQQRIFSTLSHQSGGGDSGYSEDSFAFRSFHRRASHTSCSQCHCEQRSSFQNSRQQPRQSSSTDSSSSDMAPLPKENLFSSQSYPHIKPLPPVNPIQSRERIVRTLKEKRRRNLSCDSSLWTRTQKSTILATSSPVFSESNHRPLQRHFTTIGPTTRYHQPSKSNADVFGELNLAAIELDSLRFSSSPAYSSSSTSSSSTKNTKPHPTRTLLVWHEYNNSSLLSATNGTKVFSVKRGDQVHLIKRIGKSTLLVQKEEDDGAIGFLPQSCLAHHHINSFLSLKGLRETVL